MMRRLGSVQQKIPCVFLTEVKEEQSRKRECQQFPVVATSQRTPVAWRRMSLWRFHGKLMVPAVMSQFIKESPEDLAEASPGTANDGTH
ncbi:uncharacterized protein AKAME5_002630400 [Lates japonicus]|uniref:RNA ligase 1 n=1 Tax=Lates japonicus TaxID=270547 RepID=A0AAD3RNI6_LATJO|nr:uncharacterized protein AKAME5_002630400 [Lates japonicus]